MPKGCLNKLILFVIVLFTGLTVLVAGAYIGYLLVQDNIKSQLNSTNDALKTRAESIAKFSRIPAGFSVTKAVSIAGIKVVLATHAYSGQVMGIADPGWLLDIYSKNITMPELKDKIDKLIVHINKQDKFKINNFTMEKISSFKALNQTIPYMKVSFTIAYPDHKEDYKAMIGIIENRSKNKNNMILSYNLPKDFRQTNAERFFQNIEFQ